MGLGAIVMRSILGIAASGMLYASVGAPLISKLMPDNTPIEAGFVNPNSLSPEGRKNAQGNREAYLNYKMGDETISLPCFKGPAGPLCGTVEYWWQSIGLGQREELVVGEWTAISNDAKHGILSSELQVLVDTFYGAQNGTQKTPAQQTQQQYQQPKQK